MKRMPVFAVMLVVLVFLVGCATIPEGSVPWDQMTYKDKAYQFNLTYNHLVADYKQMAAMPNLTDAQKELMRIKWEVFQELWPLITIYSQTANAGGVPSVDSEEAILIFLNQLGARLGQ